jgi:hypothetical protein
MVAGLLAAGAPPAAMAAGALAATARPVAAPVTAAGNLHGFRLAYEKANPDGSVTAVLRRRDVAIVYLGGGGSHLSVSTAAKLVTVKVHGKKKHVLRQGLLAGASNPTTPAGQAAPLFGPAGFAATRTVISDLAGAGLPARAAALIAAQDAKMTRTDLLPYIPDATSPGGHGHISSWCIDTLYGASKSAVSTGCDVRTVLQEQSGNNYIADDMEGTASCASRPCHGFLEFNIHVDYSFTADNTVVKMVPNSQQTTGCSPSPTVTFGWFNLSFSWSEETCNGTMTPQGIGTATNVGGYWVGSCGIITCDGDTPLDIEEIAQDHATASTNPDTTLHVFQQWTTNSFGSTGSDGGSCPDSGC